MPTPTSNDVIPDFPGLRGRSSGGFPNGGGVPPGLQQYLQSLGYNVTSGAGNSNSATPNTSLAGMPTVNYNSNDPGALLGQVTARDAWLFENIYGPQFQQMAASLDDTSIIDDTRESILAGQGDQQERSLRFMRRYGQQLTPIQAQQLERRAAFDRASTFDTGVNEARIEQKSRNDGLRRELINIARGVATSADQGLGQAAGMQAQREANNRMARAQQRAQTMSTIGNLGAAALLFFAI